MQYPISGSCQCGGVTYRLLAAPKMVVACHCKECQKLSTSAFSITAMVDAADLDIQGALQDWSRKAESGNTSAAKFCPTCGNRIYHYDPANPSAIKLKPSNLSDTRIIQPTAHVWVSEKQDWYQIPEGVKVFDKQP
ncbi:Glutathione-dependent formaldehyde-activating enzyme [Marinomonas aquimarina]|uniref:Glutathione-dependent formaldehyde-activating enzyme n=1 Tax=Marinomonas aquimarina TaxID=295068 RepID=A0A1A8TAH7_9GAMM|nr:GFA family protein [Marinomonas aquimarina]SBS28504.1 Glutathione-dependent formaldehyde-activating enzyme [Marinomonas aquimarina]